MTCKLAHWYTLPWSSCGLMRHDQQRARKQWDHICGNNKPDHVIANKTVQRLFSEPYLQKSELWAASEYIMSQACSDMSLLLAPLAYMYTAKRAVEAQHAKQRATRETPFHSVTCVSLLLRMTKMRMLLMANPDFVKDLALCSSEFQSYNKAMHALGMWYHLF